MPDLPRVAVEVIAPAPGGERPGPLAGPPAAPELREAMLTACTAAAGGAAECVERGAARTSAAILVAFRSEVRARVEVSARRGDPAWSSRELQFADSDATVERYRALGFAGGTLAAEFLRLRVPPEEMPVAANDAPPATAPPPTEAAAATPPEPAKQAPEEVPPAEAPATVAERHGAPREPRLFIDAAFASGSALSSGPPRLGGALRGALVFGGPFATVALAYGARPASGEAPSATFVTGSAGVGYALFLGAVSLDARVEVAAESLESEGRAANGRSGSAARWLGAARGGVDLAWTLLPPLGVVLGGELLTRAAPTQLRVDGRTVATVPVADYGVVAGLRLALP